MTDVLYRYTNNADVVRLEQHRVVKKTPRGAWIDTYGRRRFVRDDTVKRYAYPTEEEAKVSFFARKRRQLHILKAQIEGVEGAVLALQGGRLNDYRGSSFTFD